MEAVFLIGGIVLFVLFGPWILLWRSNVRRRKERLEDQTRWADLTGRVHHLERELREVSDRAASFGKESTPGQSVSQPLPVQPPAAPVTPRAAEPAFSQPRVEAFILRKESVPPPPAPIPTRDPVVLPAQAAPQTEPTFTPVEPAPSFADRFKSSLDLEETLGTNWLNKIGVVILVLGVAFFLAYQLQTLGPAGKVLVGFVTSGVMLGAGIWFERHDRYRILARAGVGGGWALLFFTTYSMYHVPAAHVLSSQALDLILMLAVAAAMVAHTLRYRSQVVTGLAFLLAFLTVTISHSNVYSLSAGAVLAAGLVVIVGRMQWFELEVFGILASYLNHYLWLRPIIEPMHGKRHPFPEFAASAAILVLYWVIFRVSYVFRNPSSKPQERISSAAAVLNTALLLALFKYQSTHPEWAFWALLAIGAIETLLGQLPVTRRRRTAVIVLSTLGVVLLIAAVPFRYSGMRLAVPWLMEAEALLLIGVWTKEVVFRRLGMLASVLVAGQLLGVEAAQVFGRRLDGADLRADFGLAIAFAVAAAVFYANAHWILPRWSSLFATEYDRRGMHRLSYAAAVMILVAAWIAFPEAWTAVAWCAAGLLLALAASRMKIADLQYQANCFAASAVIRALTINLEATGKYHGLTQRLLTIALVAVGLYVSSRWSWDAGEQRGLTLKYRGVAELFTFRQLVSGAYLWAASFLLALLAWYELQPVGVAVAWMVGGLALLELGLTRKSLGLRLQGYTAFAASFARIFFVNLNAAGNPGEISPRFYTVVPLALAFFYAYWRLQQSRDELFEPGRRWKAADFCCYLGTITIAALMRFELEADWVAAAWAALVGILLALAWRSGQRMFLHQGLLVGAGVLFRTLLHNFYERSYFPAPPWQSRWVTVGATVGLLLASLPIAFKIREQNQAPDREGLMRFVSFIVGRPEQIFFFIAIGLLTGLLAVEMRHGMVTLAWGVEGVAVFLLALWLGERSFRLTGLGLLLLCVGKILVVDVWGLNPRDRYLTFIVLGTALLLVSFLYTRNREALRQYL
jgi:uncharacterized membrane protein